VDGPQRFPEPGAEIANYRLQSVLARGGLGVVYRALDLQLSRPVALRVFTPEASAHEAARPRFVRESRLAASLDHPNILPIYGAGEWSGLLYLATRFVGGTDLGTELQRRGAIPLPEARRILGDVAAALDAAHAVGLVHRNVAPGSILLSADQVDGRPQVYLTDFGLAPRTATATGPAASTTTGGRLPGAVDGVAPEQIRGEDVDGRADVYALAGVAYTVLAGHPPFAPGDDSARTGTHRGEGAPRLSTERPGIPAAVERALVRGMATNREDRPSSCGALVALMSEEAAVGGTPVEDTAEGGAPAVEAPRGPDPSGAAAAPGPAATPRDTPSGGGPDGGGPADGGEGALAAAGRSGAPSGAETARRADEPRSAEAIRSAETTGSADQATAHAARPGGHPGSRHRGASAERRGLRWAAVLGAVALVVLVALAAGLLIPRLTAGGQRVPFGAEGIPYTLEVPEEWTARTQGDGNSTVSVLSDADSSAFFADDPEAAAAVAQAVADDPAGVVGLAIYHRPSGLGGQAPEARVGAAEALLPGRDAHLVDRGEVRIGELQGQAMDGSLPLASGVTLQVRVLVVESDPVQLWVFFAPPSLFPERTEVFDEVAGSLHGTQ
jgi:hypothetical protein